MSEHNNILSHYKLASQDTLNKELSKLTPLKYNKFFWWRNYTNPNKPLSKHSSLVEKIHNGDYDISHYDAAETLWQHKMLCVSRNLSVPI